MNWSGKDFWLEKRKARYCQSSMVLEELFIFYNSSKKQSTHKLGFDQCLEGIMIQLLMIDGTWTW